MSEQRLIDANALLRLICDFNCDSCEHFSIDDGGCTDIAASFAKIVNGMQTIDPVRKGKWINTSGYDDWYCSECDFEINYDGDYPTEYDNFKYCGRCGAKMDKE